MWATNEEKAEFCVKFPELYHYTTINGLWGIMKSNGIWATHYKHLNDQKEFDIYNDILFSSMQKTLNNSLQSAWLGSDMKELSKQRSLEHIESISRNTLSAATTGPYITSFCNKPADKIVAENGLLSQWRGYGKDGGAIIVFDTKELFSCLEKNETKVAFSWSPCKVRYYQQDMAFDRDIEKDTTFICETFAALELGGNLSTNTFDEVVKKYAACVSSIKHCAFKEEDEIRLVIAPTVFDDERIAWGKKNKNEAKEYIIEYRERADGELISYICIPFSDQISNPIKKLIIGPHPSQSLRLATAQTITAKVGIKVACSDIPLRW